MEEKGYEKRYKHLLNDTLLFVISSFGSKILVLLLVPLYTSVLTTEEYGVADILITTVNLLAQVLTLSIYEATLRFTIDKNNKSKDVLFNSIVIISLSSIMVIILALFLKGTDNIFANYWWLLIALFTTAALHTCLGNYAKGKDRSIVFAIVGILDTLVLVASNIVFLIVLKVGIYGYLISIIIANICSSLFIIIALRAWEEMLKPSFNVELMKKMVAYSMPLVPSAIAWWVNTSADKYMLIAFVGEGANGLYAVAHKIPAIVTALTGVFSQAWRISAISAFEDFGYKSDGFYSKVYETYLIVSIYICIAVTFFSPLIAKILFREDYFAAWVLVPPLLLASVFEALSGFLASIYAALKKTNILFLSTVFGAALNIFLNCILIKRWSILGAPIATFISFSAVWIIREIVLNRMIVIRRNYVRILLSLFILTIGGMYFAFNFPLKYLFYLIGFLVILLLNYTTTKELVKDIYLAVKRSIKIQLGKYR